MAEDWSIDVRKYVPNADSKVIDAIVRHCGIALQNRDSSLVSFSDAAEVGRVRENYLKKKLGLTDSDAVLNDAIADVGERMKGDRTKNRVTVYYLLAQHFRKLSVFGGTDVAGGIGGVGKATLAAGALGAGAVAASVGNAATDASATVADFVDRPHRVEDRPPPAAPVYAARSTAAAAPAASGGLGRWLPWLLGLAALALLAWFLLGRNTTTTAPVAEVRTAPPPAAVAPVEAAPATVAPAIATPAPAAVPAPSVGLPAVHFALGSAAISAADGRAIDEAAAAIKQNSLKVAVTGYTDRTGNLAINAPLAQQRANAVRDRLVAAGVPAGDIEMVAPAAVENGPAGAADVEARRVEISRR